MPVSNSSSRFRATSPRPRSSAWRSRPTMMRSTTFVKPRTCGGAAGSSGMRVMLLPRTEPEEDRPQLSSCRGGDAGAAPSGVRPLRT
eukprot:15435037-Alexandrium_andersonii.AAC.1